MRNRPPASARAALLASAVVLIVTVPGCSEPAPLDELPCHQSPEVAPLPTALVGFLAPTYPADYLALAEALLADGTVSLSHRPPYLLPADLSWTEDPFGDPSWVYEFHSLFFVLELLLAYRDTEDDAFLDLAEHLVEDFMSDHNRQSYGAGWGDLVTANRTRILLWTWELLRQRDAQAESVLNLCRTLEHHGRRLADPAAYTVNHNHGYFQDEALLVLAHGSSEIPDAPRWKQLALDRVSAQIDFAVADDGVQREHSPSYHAGMLLRFVKLGRLLSDLGLALSVDLPTVIESMYGYITFAALPTGRAPLLGDSSRWIGSANMAFITDEALYSLTRGSSGQAPEAADRVFEQGGYAFLRDRWHGAEDFDQTVYLAFVAAAHSRTHKHCDDLSVLLWGYGEEWLVDAGFWSYDPDDLYQVLAVSPAGHNVVEVDGQSYYEALPTERDESAGLELLSSHDLGITHSVVRGRHRLNDGVLFDRELTYERPNQALVSDALTAEDERSHTYVLYWHVAADKQVEEVASGEFRITTAEGTGPELGLVVTGSAALSCGITQAATDPYQGWVFPAFLQAEPAPVIHCRQEGSDVSFETSLELRSSRSAPRSAEAR